jgi:hypothetical protein
MIAAISTSRLYGNDSNASLFEGWIIHFQGAKSRYQSHSLYILIFDRKPPFLALDYTANAKCISHLSMYNQQKGTFDENR